MILILIKIHDHFWQMEKCQMTKQIQNKDKTFARFLNVTLFSGRMNV